MIHFCLASALVQLDDGRAAIWARNQWICSDHLSNIAILKACPDGNSLAFLTRDNRVRIIAPPLNGTTDITSTVNECMGQTAIHDLLIDNRTIIIRSGRTIGVIELRSIEAIKGKPSKIILGYSKHEFEADIDLVVAAHNRCYVKTTDEKLFSLDNLNGIISAMTKPTYTPRRLSDLTIGQTSATITNITICPRRTFVTMDNGSVYGRLVKKQASIIALLGLSEPQFRRVNFFDSLSVRTIIPDQLACFFITTTGNCYYSKEGNSPVLLKSLEGFPVNNVFIGKTGIIIQLDGSSLCWVSDIDSYISGDAEVVDAQFEGGCIQSAICVEENIMIVTTNNNIYSIATPFEDVIRSMRHTFFDQNPIAYWA